MSGRAVELVEADEERPSEWGVKGREGVEDAKEEALPPSFFASKF